jgi:catechol 2,3-dioxygenase-like lactoylglutathione lyase family enzyme
MSHLSLTAILVDDYDRAITFFTEALGFEVSEDSPSQTNEGQPKRWVVVRPSGGETGFLIARADGDEQVRGIGNQFAGRVGFFLRVDDFAEVYGRLKGHNVEFVGEPRSEVYGQVVVFVDIWGNKWDLLGPLN